MACDKPGDGACTPIAMCADCTGCAGCGAPAEPVLPRCQDVQLTPGTYTNATIVVNAQGCIVAITSGTPPVYTPDDCCQ